MSKNSRKGWLNMDKKEILRRLMVLQADILDTNRAVAEIIVKLEDDQESEPTPLPETPS